MKAFLTGATGFIGSRLARALSERGWEVVALVRSPERAVHLKPFGVSLALGDITEPSSLDEPLYGCDAVFHLAAHLRYGVTDRDAMVRANVHGTRNVLEAALAASVSRIVHCSSVAALGPGAPGDIRDETSTHPDRFPSVYEETKWEAHQVARRLAASGAPVVTVLPGAVYGPGETGLIGRLVGLYARGWLVALPLMSFGLSYVHVDDVVEGMLRAHDKGPTGEEYVLGGDNASLRELFERLAPVTGIRPPRFEVPESVLPFFKPLAPLIGRALGQSSRFYEEGLDSLRGSYMASSAKAERELGYRFRPIEEGMGEMVQWAKDH